MHSVIHLGWGIAKHLAMGYLLYSVVLHVRGRGPTGVASLMAVSGAVFPDLVDKPLVAVGLLDYGRGIGHSLFTALLVVLICQALLSRYHRPDLGTAFAIGYASHIIVDMYGTVLTGQQSINTAFLLWPILVDYPLGIMTPSMPVAKRTIFSVVIVAALAAWIYDRTPGVAELRDAFAPDPPTE